MTGSEPVVVVSEGATSEFPVRDLTKEQIVDTNGAGDAFVGGFLAQYVQERRLKKKVSRGAIGAQRACFPN